MSPTKAALNGSLMYLYLPTVQENTVKYDDHLSSFRLWQPQLAWFSVRKFKLAGLHRITFNVGPLCTGLIHSLLSLDGSRHNLALQFNLGINMKLLHYSDVSFMPRRLLFAAFVTSLTVLGVPSVHTLTFPGPPGMACCHPSLVN